MIFKLNRWTIIFSSEFVPFVFFAIIVFLMGILNNGMKESFIVAIIVLFIAAFLYPLNFPRKFEVNYNEIIYSSKISIPEKHGRGHKKTSCVFKVKNIVGYKFSQTWIEKRLNIGTISFRGSTSVDSKKYADEIQPPIFHQINGIVNFNEAKEKIIIRLKTEEDS